MLKNGSENSGADNARRGLVFKTAGVIGAAAYAAGTTTDVLAAKKPEKKETKEEKKEKPENRKFKIGVFGLDYSFWNGIWNDLLLPHGKIVGTSILNMEMAYVWDKDMKKAQDFADKNGCEVVKTYDGMLGKVDGVVNGDLYNVPWQHLLFKPYIEAGVPCYLSRPWSSRLKDLDYMLDMAAKHNTAIIATNTYEHYNEGESFQKEILKVGKIQAVYGTCSSGDHPHFHLPYLMKRILGFDVDTVSLISNDPKKIIYMHDLHVYKERDNQPQFTLSMNARVTAHVFSFTIIGDKATISASMPESSNYMWRFAPQLLDIQKTIDSKQSYQPLDVVRKKFESCIAEYYSHYEKGGAPVKVGSVPADWQYPLWMPNWYSDSDFKM